MRWHSDNGRGKRLRHPSHLLSFSLLRLLILDCKSAARPLFVGIPVAKRTQKCSEESGRGKCVQAASSLSSSGSLCEGSVLRRLRCRAPSERGMIYGALFITGHGHFSGTQLAGTTACGSCTLCLPPFPSLSFSLPLWNGVPCPTWLFIALVVFFLLCFACIWMLMPHIVLWNADGLRRLTAKRFSCIQEFVQLQIIMRVIIYLLWI